MNFWLPGAVLLAAIVALICVTPGPQIFEQEIVLPYQAMRCFQLVTDFTHYPSWLDSVKSTKCDVDPASAVPGTQFDVVFKRNYIDPNKITAEITELVEGMRYGFELNDWLNTNIQFTVKSLPQAQCKITVAMSSGKDNFLNNNLVVPVARMYLYNWMLKSLLALKTAAR